MMGSWCKLKPLMPKTAKQLFDKWFCFSFNLVLISGFKGTLRTHRFAKSFHTFLLGVITFTYLGF